MFTGRALKTKAVISFTYKGFLFGSLWGGLAVVLYQIVGWDWLRIPWAPLSLIGIALAFFTGFKNNAAYDRLWEARKVWGAVVNSSRAWGTSVKHFVTNQFTTDNASTAQLSTKHRELMYRHIAWLYILRHQLLKPTSWEHTESITKSHREESVKRKTQLMNMFSAGEIQENLKKFIDDEEINALLKNANGATQIIERQAKTLADLREQNLIDDFRHMELQKLLNDFYVQQGKLERIKKFPFPRQYASSSFYFLSIFILLLPFGIIPEALELKNAGDYAIWLTVPATGLISWVFGLMEMVGDYSENPFEGLANDVPMLSLVRTIEIDLREMLGEVELPPKVEAHNDILM